MRPRDHALRHIVADDLKLAAAGLRLISLFAQDPTRRWSGAEITSEISSGSGTLYPLLAKFETLKILKAEWEDVDPSKIGRPRRRYYSLTGLGVWRARSILAEFQFSSSSGRLAWNT
jgi:PadR family transcriptional regulator PadR